MLDASAAAGRPRRPPFFVLGAPRSGTSLLGRMLNAHPTLAVPDEVKLVETFLPLLPLYGDLGRSRRLRRLVQDMLRWRWVRRLPGVPTPEVVLARVGRPDLGGVIAALLDAWTVGQRKARWGEKTPSNLYFWPVLAASFPESPVVHILRDGRDVVLSQIEAPFGPKTLAASAERWVRFVQGIRAIGAAGGRPYVEIRYEDLLARPEATIGRVLDALGEPFDPAVLQFHRNARPVGTDPINDRNIHRPLQVLNRGKWRTALRARDLATVEAVAGPLLAACGYERCTEVPPMGRAEHLARRWLEHPPVKLAAMLRNRSGLDEALERQRLCWRLRADHFRERLAAGAGDLPPLEREAT
jgi:hypothetical protein